VNQHRLRPGLLGLEDRLLLTTFLVNSTSDNNSTGTLRAEIAAANASPGANTIEFDPNVFATPLTINLSGSQLELTNISGTQTITGPAAGVTINAGGQFRDFEVEAGVTASITGVNFTDGTVTGNGGGFYNLGATTLTDCTISGNTATKHSGGGLYNSGTATLVNCSITSNSAENGGGLENEKGTMTLTGCMVTQNNASGYYGGGVDNSANVSLTNCTVSGNSATDSGGGLNNHPGGTASLTNCTLETNHAKYNGGLINDATATLSGCTISSNTALDNGGVGNGGGTIKLTDCTLAGNSAGIACGGLNESKGTATLIDCTLSGNTAQVAGGVDVGAYGRAYLTGCTLTGNSATLYRGGALLAAGYETALTACTITGNSAKTTGGGFYITAKLNLTACTVTANLATSNGGGVYDKGSVALIDTIIAGNIITNTTTPNDIQGPNNVSGSYNLIGTGGAGGLQSGSNGNIILPNLNTLGLAPLGYYGGPTETMALLAKSAAVHTGTAATGVSTDQRGEPLDSPPDIGAFQIQTKLVINTTGDATLSPSAELTLREAVNVADVEDGALTISFDPTVFSAPQTITLTLGQLELSDIEGPQTITGPSAGVLISGGGQSRVLQIDGGVTASLSGLTITDGSTTGSGGGLKNSGTTALTNCTLSGNSAGSGGGVYNDGTVKITDCTIFGNSATTSGGGLDSVGTASVTECTVSGNSAEGGGGLSLGGNASLIGCTLSANYASANGGGLDASGTANLKDTIVAGNTGGGSSASDISGTVSTASSNNLIGTGGAGGLLNGSSGNIVLTTLADLGLAPLGNYGGPSQTMALLPSSPAIGSGAGSSGISADERGAPRPTSGAVDIGAFQDQGYTLAVSSGGPQTTLVSQAFQSPLVVELSEDFADAPLPTATIVYAAPSSGASATLSASSAVTGANGQASVTATANATAGAYSVTASVSGLTMPASFVLTNQIQPAFSGLTNQTVTYGSAVTFSGTLAAGAQIPAGENVAVTVGAKTLDAPIAADGSFSVQFTRSDVVLDANAAAYSVIYQYATDGVFLAAHSSSLLTVNPEALTVTAVAYTKTYDATPSAPSAVPMVTSGTIATGDTPEFTETYSTKNVGNGLTLTPSGIVSDGNSGNNYTYTFVPVSTGVIQAAALEITANSTSKTYGQTVTFAGTEFTANGLAGSDTVTSVTLMCAGTAATATVAGAPYAIVPSAAVGSGLSNYSITYTNGNLAVSAAPLSIFANSSTKTYGQTVSFTGTEFVADGLLNSDTVSSVTLASAGAAATATVGGAPYAIVPSAAVGSGLSNYNISYMNGSLSVSAASLTITANSTSKTYGQTVSFAGTEFTVTGLLNSDTATSVTLTSAGAAATAMVGGAPYPIIPGAAVGSGLTNYSISYVNGNLAVSPAALTITADSTSKTYGQTDNFAGTEFTEQGLVNSDAVNTVTLTSAGAAATATVGGGPYSIVPSAAVGTGLANYTISYANGSLAVSAASLTITANSPSKTYGQTLSFTGTEFTEQGLVNSDTVTSVTLTSAGTAATATLGGGPYAIIPSAAVGSGLANYSISYVNGSLSVSAATLTITASNANKTYGSGFVLIGSEFTETGLVNSDTVTSVTLTSAGTPAGATVTGSPYSIVPSAAVGSGLSNYSISYVNGNLTVSPAALKITANNASKVSGQANPKFSASYSGFVNGDTSASLTTQPTFSTTATTTSPAGTYPIKVSGAVDSNYTITIVPGTLTVNPPLATVKSFEVENIKSGKKSTEVIVIQFGAALKTAAAQNINAYSLVTVPASTKQKGKPVSLASARYNARTFTVTLTTSKALVLSPPVNLTITAARVLDSLGRPLAANYSATLKKVGVPVKPSAVPLVRARALSAAAVDALLAAGLRGPLKSGVG
jgi:hypothetical protein